MLIFHSSFRNLTTLESGRRLETTFDIVFVGRSNPYPDNMEKSGFVGFDRATTVHFVCKKLSFKLFTSVQTTAVFGSGNISIGNNLV